MNTDSVLDSYPNPVSSKKINTDSDPEIHNPGLLIKIVYHLDRDELRLHRSTTLVY
jgi:hypothetical protein